MRYLFCTIDICLALILVSCKENGTVVYYRHIDFSGVHNVKLKYPINPDTTKSGYYFKVVFDGRGRIVSIKFPNVGGQGNDPKVIYSTLSISYSSRREKRLFFDPRGLSVINEKGVYSEIYALNSKGFPKSMANLDNNGKTIEDSLGVSSYVLKTDDRGLITDCLRLNIKGDTIIDNKGYYRTHFIYANGGFIVEQANYEKDGALSEAANGIAIIRYKYDSLGNIIEEYYFDENNRPKGEIENKAASLKYFYDGVGRAVECRYFNEFDELVDNSCPILKINYDEDGRVIEYDCCGSNQIPIHTMKLTSSGASSETRCFDSNGNPAVDSAWGFAAYIVKFDSQENKIEENYLDDKMKPIIPKDYSFASIKYEYNTHNNLTKCSWYDANGVICENDGLSCAILTYDYDYPRGIVITTCRDIRGFVKECKYGYAVRRSQYDRVGNIKDDRYFDKSGNLITDVRFDKEGRRIE